MSKVDKCPVCGGELVEKEVEKLLKGGSNIAVVRVKALVCTRCGERLYTAATVRQFEQIRRKLAKQEVADFRPVGRFFRVEQIPS